MKNQGLCLDAFIAKGYKIETKEAFKKVQGGGRVVYTPNSGIIDQPAGMSMNASDSNRHMYVSNL